jgi:phage terminase large subunit-like protein
MAPTDLPWEEWAPIDRAIALHGLDAVRALFKPGERITWRMQARPRQLAPAGDWRTWLILAGRGWGKTRTVCEWVREKAKQPDRRIALIARTNADVRDVLVEGASGVLSLYGANDPTKPLYEPSKRRVTWHNGTIATTYSAEDGDLLRGPQHHFGVLDEVATYEGEDTWNNFQLGLRLGSNPQCVIATTPRPRDLLRKIAADPTTIKTTRSTYDNSRNLAPAFLAETIKRYEGTRLGRQELLAEILDDEENALWTTALLDATRVQTAPTCGRIVVAVDPSAGSKVTNDEQGICVCGEATGALVGADGMPLAEYYVLADLTCKLSPEGWGARAVQAAIDYGADCVVAERNCGGDMVASVIKAAAERLHVTVRVEMVTATRGKHVRAEPIAALFEQGRGHIVGSMPEMEREAVRFTPAGYSESKSPNRMDACVHALTALSGADLRLVTHPEAESVPAWDL